MIKVLIEQRNRSIRTLNICRHETISNVKLVSVSFQREETYRFDHSNSCRWFPSKSRWKWKRIFQWKSKNKISTDHHKELTNSRYPFVNVTFNNWSSNIRRLFDVRTHSKFFFEIWKKKLFVSLRTAKRSELRKDYFQNSIFEKVTMNTGNRRRSLREKKQRKTFQLFGKNENEKTNLFVRWILRLVH